MKTTHTSIPGVVLLQPKVFGDDRGFFFESFNEQVFEQAVGIAPIFKQDNHSRSVRGVLRGLHYQIAQPQGKLVRVARGSIFDVAVDIRKDSPTFGRWVGAELSESNRNQLWVPAGLAHGFLVLSEVADVLYKATNYYSPAHERSIAWSDPALAIEWPDIGSPPILSSKDAAALTMAEQLTLDES